MAKYHNWREEWVDMPEFISNDMQSVKQLVVHFRNQEDVDAFAELLGQKITPKQVSIWYPEMKRRVASDKKYFDDES